MEPLTTLRGPAAPLPLPDINTDIISPAHGGRGDLTANAFAPLRYLPNGDENPSFILNDERFRCAPILVTGQNFGCGSSRESAVWSVRALGIRCVIAASFGDIFFDNCFHNGVLPVVLPADILDMLAEEASTGLDFELDLPAGELRTPSGRQVSFEVNPTRKMQLLEGLDDLDVGLRRRQEILAFQRADRVRRPWIYE
jgi:3-isopropylmalate/(R)-2-methylmalate dehydratase small subunit